MRALRVALLLGLIGLFGCATGATRSDHYLRYVAFEAPGGEKVALRWRKQEMPLRVHLPPPSPEIADDPEAVFEAVRDGITDWEGVAGEGLPRFTFVDDPGDADIPIVWEGTPSGDWYIAHCIYHLHVMQRRFGVARILVTTHWRGEEVALDLLYQAMLHEMGHALGIGGHSPEPGDIMFQSVSTASELSARDRETLRILYARPNGKAIVGARSAD